MKSSRQISVLEPSIQDAVEGEGEELEALARVKLVLELHPVQKIKKQFRQNEQEASRTSGDWLSGWVMLSRAVVADDPCSSFHTHLHPLMSTSLLLDPVLGLDT